MVSCALVNVWALAFAGGADPKPQDAHTWTEIRFHEGGVLLGFSADGKYVAAGGSGEVRVWAVADQKEVVRMKLPDDRGVVFGAFAADGKHLVTANKTDDKLRYWDLVTGKQAKAVELARGKDAEWVVGFSPGGGHLALKVETGIVLIDAATGKVALELDGAGPGGTGFFKQMGGAFSPDGKRFAARAGKGQLAVWDVATGKRLACSPAKEHDVSGSFVFVRFSPDGRFIATGAGGPINHLIHVWDAATCALLAEPLKIEGFTTALGWTPDGSTVVTLDYNGVYATDVGTGKPVHKFAPSAGSGNLWGQPQYPSPDGKHMVFHAEISSTTEPGGKVRRTWGVYLARMPPAKKPALKGELTPTELDALWADLATGNTFRREQLFPALAAAPDTAVPYLVKQAPVATADEVKYLRELMAELASDDARKRRTANERLTKRAHRFAALFRDALPDAPAGNARDVLTALVADAKDKPLPDDLRAELRAVELLARLRTPDAVKHLKALAAGAPQSHVTAAAKAALEKLKP
jgi:hypothetical protein